MVKEVGNMINSNNRKISVFLSYLSQLIHILSGLIYTPIMLRMLGQSEYGLYQLVASVVSYLSLLSLGFSGSYMRFYSRYKVKNDEQGVAKLNGMFMTIFLTMMIVALISGLIMVANLQTIFGTGLTDAELHKAKILFLILVVNLALTFPMSVYDCNLIAHEEYVFQKLLLVLQNLFSPIITLPLLLIGYGSVAMVCVTTCLTFSKLLLSLIYCKRKLKVRFEFRGMQLSLLKELAVFNTFILINQIINQINWNLDKFLLGRMAGTAAVAIYSVAAQLNSMYMQLENAIPSVYTTQINLMVARNSSKDEINSVFSNVARIQFSVIGLVISGYVFFGANFIELWAGKEYQDSYQIGLLLMLPATIPYIQCLGYEIQRAMNMHKARSIIYLCVAVMNLFVSIPCIRQWGARGAAIGTALTFILGHGIFMNLYYHKKMGLNMFAFWSKLKSFIPAYLLIICCGIIFNRFFYAENYLQIFMQIGIYSVVYICSIIFIALNPYERNIILKKIKKR